MEKKIEAKAVKLEQFAELEQWSIALCQYAGVTKEFQESFWSELSECEEVYEEFRYFYNNQNFLCKYKVAGYSVVDILVWQIDHFKEHLDREPSMRTNKDKMILMAFVTLLDMRKNPEKYVLQMETQTGTDYFGKF